MSSGVSTDNKFLTVPSPKFQVMSAFFKQLDSSPIIDRLSNKILVLIQLLSGASNSATEDSKTVILDIVKGVDEQAFCIVKVATN